MKKLAMVFALVAFVCGIFSYAVAGEGPAEIKLPAKMGEVTFPHHAHQAKVADCTACHHNGVDAGSCTSCHGVKPEAPAAKDAFHKQCKECHQKNGGPTSCKACHTGGK